MANSGVRRDIPGWVAAVAVGVIVVVLVVVGVMMSRPAPTANTVTKIGVGNSGQSYLSHYGRPPAGSTSAGQSTPGGH